MGVIPLYDITDTYQLVLEQSCELTVNEAVSQYGTARALAAVRGHSRYIGVQILQRMYPQATESALILTFVGLWRSQPWRIQAAED